MKDSFERDIFECVRLGTLTPALGAHMLIGRRATWLERLICRLIGHADYDIPETKVCSGCSRCGRLLVREPNA